MAKPLSDPSVTQQVQFDKICMQFEQAWRQDRKPTIEAFLEETPEPQRSSLLSQLLLLELEYVETSGTLAKIDGYLERFPKDRDLVRHAFEEHSAALERDLCLERVGVALDRTSDARAPEYTFDHGQITERPGSQIGRYKLLEQIGEGGMGVVYMADQLRPVRRKVALKIIKPGMDTKQVVARFEAERQALAMMDHANIAKVLDAGATDSGRPYFVMELVKGIPITEFCDNKRLGSRKRLEIFTSVCRGIQHAHHKGVVHRDVKPSNVLVAEYDDHPVAKIIDFGIAKAASHDLTEKTLFTQFGQIVGTLEYMSPEQAKFNQRDIDSRSDIYSLGALLYELLTGSTPIEGGRLRESGLEEFLRIIREEEPPRPSTRLSSSNMLSALAAKRSTDPERLAGPLREDLDWIVAKAMAKDRGDRYQTAESFANDIEHHMSDLSIEARRPSFIGRVRRFTRRNRKTVSMASLILALSVVATTLGTIAYFGELKQESQQTALSEAEASQTSAEQRRWAHETAMPDVIRLTSEARHTEAFMLACKIKDTLSGIPTFEELWNDVTVSVSFDALPDGTTVSYRDAWHPDGDWTVVGQAPLTDVTLPRGDLRFRFAKNGFITKEVQRRFPDFLKTGERILLTERHSVPAGMEWIPAVEAAKEKLLVADLSEFLIDRYEVTNGEYQEFVDAGGYKQSKYWSDLEFSRDGKKLSWEKAMDFFVDASSKEHGPAGWRGGKFPVGTDSMPVGGVSWFEAAAYAKFADKSLPTIHHWNWAGSADQPGLTMKMSNFNGKGPTPRGAHNTIGRFEVYDMAGNMKEWCWNKDESGRRCLRGSAWNEHDYRFFFVDVESPWSRLETHGFRCVCYLNASAPEELTTKKRETPVVRFADKERQPLDSLLRWYQYDRQLPLNAVQIQLDDSEPSDDFRHEIVRIDAVYGNERFDLHLFLPRRRQENHETFIYVPGMGAWNPGREFVVGEISDWGTIKELPKHGRIVCYPVYQGTYERCDGRAYLTKFKESPIQGRDDHIAINKDMSRAIDYLLTRDDVDEDRLVYYGLSLGAMIGPSALVTDGRFKAAVLNAGGYTFFQHHVPETSPHQFARHVKTPVLMINSPTDTHFPYETAQLPMYEELGCEIKEHILRPYKHTVPSHVVRPIMDAWLNQVLQSATVGDDQSPEPSVESN